MVRYGWLAALVVGAASLVPAAAPEMGPQVEVVGLEVMKPDPADKFGNALVMGRPAGTTITLKIAAPDRHCISLDEDATDVTACSDDKGTNLTEDRAKGREGFDWSFDLSDDAPAALFGIRCPAVPAPGAREVSLEGTVGIKCGSAEKTVEQKDFALKVGSELTVGPAPMKIEKIEGAWGESKMQVTLSGTTNPETIKELVFLSADGKAMKAHITEWSYSGSPGQMTYTRTYALSEKVDVVTVRITYFTKVETLTVPVNLKIGIGF